MGIDRERLLRLATFWLRPDFVLRVVARFQSIAGFDRAIALASSALTATVPLTIFIGAIVPADTDAAARMIDRYDLTGDGAQAVRDAFQPATDVDTGLGIVGTILLFVAALSFTRTVQRLFETTWELPPLTVRNTVGGAKWLLAFVLYLGVSGAIASMVDRGVGEAIAIVLVAPLMAGFLLWTGIVLSGRRLTARDLLPFAIVAATLISAYEIGASLYTPHAFNTYAARYGVIGVVFAMISALFGLMVALVGSAAVGREVRVELDNIAAGIRPSEDELRQQWDVVMTSARARRAAVRAQLDRLRRRSVR